MPHDCRGRLIQATGGRDIAGAEPASKAGNGKPKRIEARVTAYEKDLVERAAALTGRSITDFVVSSALEKAEETIRAHQVMTLSARDNQSFAEAVLNPPSPKARQRAAAARYRNLSGV